MYLTYHAFDSVLSSGVAIPEDIAKQLEVEMRTTILYRPDHHLIFQPTFTLDTRYVEIETKK